jgi:hypothetical protein
MRLYFNKIAEEWFAVRKGYIIAHSKSLDECISIALDFVEVEKEWF